MKALSAQDEVVALLPKIIQIEQPSETVHVLVGVVDRKKQDGDAHGDSKAGQQDIVVNGLDHHAYTHQQQQLTDGADLLPAQLGSIDMAADGNHQNISAGKQVHTKVVGATDIVAGVIDSEEQSIPVVKQDKQAHQKWGNDTADASPTGPALVGLVVGPDIAQQRNGHQYLKKIQYCQAAFGHPGQVRPRQSDEKGAKQVKYDVCDAKQQKSKKCLCTLGIQCALLHKVVQDDQQKDQC